MKLTKKDIKLTFGILVALVIVVSIALNPISRDEMSSKLKYTLLKVK